MPGSEQSCGRLFISYSRKNKAEVYPFADALAQAGVGVWIDKENIDPLDDFPARNLRRSRPLARAARLVLDGIRPIQLLPEGTHRRLDLRWAEQAASERAHV